MATSFSAADLPITSAGRIYHLDLHPSELSSDIILVGDPDRVPFLAGHFFKEVRVDRMHRGLRTMTGVTERGVEVSIVTSGMGTPSTEIVLQEIVALHEIDFASRTRKKSFPLLRVVRVGTSGALRQTTRLGTPVLAVYGVGLDNTALFYDTPASPDLITLEREVTAILERTGTGARFRNAVVPYAAAASRSLLQRLRDAAQLSQIDVNEGITISNSGFFANQGRSVARCSLTFPDLDGAFGDASPPFAGLYYENMEMETSFLFHFLGALGHEAGSINVALANRRTDSFASNPTEGVLQAAAIVVRALEDSISDRGHDQPPE